jgi:hypothetical protein
MSCEPRHGRRGRRTMMLEIGGECCCCGDGSGDFARRFSTRTESLARLESYRDELQSELEGVNERIAELSG